jgi:chaperonin GroES
MPLSMSLSPLADRLIVELLEEPGVTPGGVILPETSQEKPQRACVLAVGPGARAEDGDRIPIDVDEGDEIVFKQFTGTEISIDGEKRVILREADVLAKVT